MQTARIAALLEPFLEQPLDPSQLDQISTYIDLLQRWNARINLTAIRKEEEIVTRHFGESLFLARHLFPKNVRDAGLSVARTLLSANMNSTQLPATPQSPIPSHPERNRAKSEANGMVESKDPYPVSNTLPQGVLSTQSAPQVTDIGSGAGFPGIPLKIWAPQIHLTLIESNHKKTTFLREVARSLTLTDINVITDRAEVAAKSKDVPRAEVVTLRAVERFETILPLALAFMASRATMALLIGTTQLTQLTSLTTLTWNPPIPIPQSQSRILSIGCNYKVVIR